MAIPANNLLSIPRILTAAAAGGEEAGCNAKFAGFENERYAQSHLNRSGIPARSRLSQEQRAT